MNSNDQSTILFELSVVQDGSNTLSSQVQQELREPFHPVCQNQQCNRSGLSSAAERANEAGLAQSRQQIVFESLEKNQIPRNQQNEYCMTSNSLKQMNSVSSSIDDSIKY